MSSHRILIADLDNCISDDQWRMNLIEESGSHIEKYHRYHVASSLDQPANLHLLHGKQVAVFTARPDIYRSITTDWLRKHGIEPISLMMRQPGDTRRSPTIKLFMLARLVTQLSLRCSDIDLAIDDREDVVSVYSKVGVRTQRVAINER